MRDVYDAGPTVSQHWTSAWTGMAQQTKVIDPMLFYYRPTVDNVNPTLKRNQFNATFFQGR